MGNSSKKEEKPKEVVVVRTLDPSEFDTKNFTTRRPSAMELRVRELKGKMLNLQDQLKAAQKELADTKNRLTAAQQLISVLKGGLFSFADWRDAQSVISNLPRELSEMFALKEIDALPIPDGEYEGTIWDDLPNGKGVARYQSGNAYQGEFYRGLRHGSGCMNYISGDKFDGDWFKGSKHGFGTYIWASGEKYTGQFSKDKITGQGMKYYADGRIFMGTWNDNAWDGFGIEVSQGGLMTTVGTWSNDKLEGHISEFYLKDKLNYLAGKPHKGPTPNLASQPKANSQNPSLAGTKPNFALALTPQNVNVREKSSTVKLPEGSTERTHKPGMEPTAGGIFFDPVIEDMLNED